jgi:hypothetical protein
MIAVDDIRFVEVEMMMQRYGEMLAYIVIVFVVVIALFLLVKTVSEEERVYATVPEAVLTDHQAVVPKWTTMDVATNEFEALQHNIGREMYPFGYHEKFNFHHQGWLEYRWQDGVLILDMYLRPYYRTEELARQIASHEVGHVYAIAYLNDTSEDTAKEISACFGKTPMPYEVTTERCKILRERLTK